MYNLLMKSITVLLYNKKCGSIFRVKNGKIHFFRIYNMCFVSEYKNQSIIHKISITITKRSIELDNVTSCKGKKGFPTSHFSKIYFFWK